MEDSSKQILFFFISFIVVMIIIRCYNIYNTELTNSDLKEIENYQNYTNEANQLSNDSTQTIENFTSKKIKKLKEKRNISEKFLNSDFNKSPSKKERFKNIQNESLGEYWKRLSKIDEKWNEDTRDIIKKAIKFKKEFTNLFKF